MIPSEPTEDMIEAGCDAFVARSEDRFVIFAEDIRAVWRAMYDAAIRVAAATRDELDASKPKG